MHTLRKAEKPSLMHILALVVVLAGVALTLSKVALNVAKVFEIIKKTNHKD